LADFARRFLLALSASLLLASPLSAQNRQIIRFPLNAGSSLSIVNAYGPVTVRTSSSNQLVISATPHSSNVEIDQSKNDTRVEIRSHVLRQATPAEAQVDYDVQLPPGVSLWVRSNDGPISVTGVRAADVTCDGESARIEVKDGGSGHVHVRTVSGEIGLTNLKDSHTEITSISGDIVVRGVSGNFVSANTTKGKISYDGTFEGGGEYVFSTHSGDVNVALPADASVEISARSVMGTVEDSLHMQPAPHPSFAPSQGKALAGVLNAGASSVKLRSMTGNITVKKK
jgi:DUF4097 and DUF4098 domain-containing protein YvlB